MSENITTLSSVLLGAFATFWETILGFMPNVLATVVVLILGLMLAKFSKIIVERLLKLFKFDLLVQKAGLEAYVVDSGYDFKFTRLISGTIYWLIILLTITSIAELLHLKVISDLFERVVLYLPNIIAAFAILIFGTIFSRIGNRYVFNSLKNTSMDIALALGVVAEVVIQIFVWFLALEQLQVNTLLLLIVLSTVFGAIAFACAIAFGFAGQDLARDLLAKARNKIEKGIDSD